MGRRATAAPTDAKCKQGQGPADFDVPVPPNSVFLDRRAAVPDGHR